MILKLNPRGRQQRAGGHLLVNLQLHGSNLVGEEINDGSDVGLGAVDRRIRAANPCAVERDLETSREGSHRQTIRGREFPSPASAEEAATFRH